MLGKTLVKTLKRLIGKDPDAGKGKRRRGQRMRWLDSITEFEQTKKIAKDKGAWRATVHRVTKNQT